MVDEEEHRSIEIQRNKYALDRRLSLQGHPESGEHRDPSSRVHGEGTRYRRHVERTGSASSVSRPTRGVGVHSGIRGFNPWNDGEIDEEHLAQVDIAQKASESAAKKAKEMLMALRDPSEIDLDDIGLL